MSNENSQVDRNTRITQDRSYYTRCVNKSDLRWLIVSVWRRLERSSNCRSVATSAVQEVLRWVIVAVSGTITSPNTFWASSIEKHRSLQNPPPPPDVPGRPKKEDKSGKTRTDGSPSQDTRQHKEGVASDNRPKRGWSLPSIHDGWEGVSDRRSTWASRPHRDSAKWSHPGNGVGWSISQTPFFLTSLKQAIHEKTYQYFVFFFTQFPHFSLLLLAY